MAFRAAAVFIKLGFCPEAFAWCAVLAFIFSFINVSFVIKILEDLLHSFNMVIICCTDVSVIADIHVAPEIFEYFNNLVNILLRCNAFFGSFLLDLLTMLVRACKEHYIISLHSLVACDRVAGNSCVAVTDVRITRRIIDRCCDIKRCF